MPPKKKKNNNTRNKKTFDILYADNDVNQEYGYIEKILGNCHFRVKNIQGEEKTASLSGIMKKKCRVREHDLVLMEPLSDSIDTKYQIIFRYTQDQKKILDKEGKLKKVELEEPDKVDEDFVFGDDYINHHNNGEELDEWFIDEI